MERVEEEKQNHKATINRKRLYRAVAIIVIAIVAVAFIVYYWQSTTNIVRITYFAKTGGGETPDDMIYSFTVNITNQGHNDVSGLTLVVKVLDNGNELGNKTVLLSIPSGQEWTEKPFIDLNKNDTVGKTFSYLATLELDGKVVDEKTAAG